MPTGWRPEDVSKRYPIEVITDVYAYEKYDTRLSGFLKIWSWVQLGFNFLLMMYFFNKLDVLSFDWILFYAGFLYLSIFSYTSMMDRKSFAWILEAIKSMIGIFIIAYTADWFYINDLFEGMRIVIGSYFLLSAVMAIYLNIAEINEEKKVVAF
jgi:hypothetical protein